MLIAQKAEESREMLRESVSLLPLEHRRLLESQLSDGGLSATTSFGNPNASTNITNLGMEMSWEAVTAPTGVPMHSTPPRASSVGLVQTPNNRVGTNNRSPIVIPSSPAKSPSSPQKKSPLVPKFQPPMAPIDTQTLGRILKPPTPKRAGLLSYMTPLRTPTMAGKGGAGTGVDPDRSGAPPPTTGRAGTKNAFFDPDVRAVKGLILPPAGSSPLSAADRNKIALRTKLPRFDDDVEMRDVDAEEADTESEEEVQEELEEQSDESFVYAPPPSTLLKSNLTGGPLSANSIVQMKKARERGRERLEKEREAQERERERLAARERDMAAKRAKLEQQRKNLGGNDSSFTSTGSGSGGKRKRDGDDQMTRIDDEMEDAEMASALGGKAKRKNDSGSVQIVRKPLPATTASTNPTAPFATRSKQAIWVPKPAESVASMSSRSGALVPPTTMAPSVTSAGGHVDVPEIPRRSSRFSATSGSAPGSVTGGSQAGGSARAPSPTPEKSEHDGEDDTEEEDEEPLSPKMPGAYIPDEGDNMTDETTSGRRIRGAKSRTAAKPPSKSKTTTKPGSKKATTIVTAAAGSSSSTGTAQTRQTRSKRATTGSLVSVPTSIAEDVVLETVVEDEAMNRSPSKGKGRGKRSESGASITTGPTRRSLKAVAEDTPQPETEDHTDSGKLGTARRSSRRLTALSAGETEAATTSASSATGGRKSGRKA